MSGALSTAAAQPSTNILQPWNQQQLQMDAAASQQIRAIGRRFTQQTYQQSFVPVYGSPTVVNVPITNIGLLTRFYVQLQVTITNPAGGATLTRSGMGPFSAFSLIAYTDPNTNQRIQTTGYHLAAVTQRRHRRIPGSAYTTDSPSGFGSVIQPIAAPSSIAANNSGTVNVMYEVPLGFARNSLKGAVFAGSVFATQSLALTFNPNFAQNSADQFNISGGAVYTGASNSSPPTYACIVTVFQEFWDQFPLQLLAGISPSLSTVYELKQTIYSSIIAGSDNFIKFSNLREFHSMFIAYDNGGTQNAGTDINYFLLQSANQTKLWQRTPFLQSYLTRTKFGDDLPAGCYMMDFSEQPVITAAEGNTVMSVNPITAATGSVLLVGFEDLATSSVLASAPSLGGMAGVG